MPLFPEVRLATLHKREVRKESGHLLWLRALVTRRLIDIKHTDKTDMFLSVEIHISCCVLHVFASKKLRDAYRIWTELNIIAQHYFSHGKISNIPASKWNMKSCLGET
jgi:hypothetical protein